MSDEKPNTDMGCPACGKKTVRYVQETVEFHSFRLTEDDDYVELIEVKESFPGDTFHFQCGSCLKKWKSVKAYKEAKGIT